jgi:hypothetical protein
MFERPTPIPDLVAKIPGTRTGENAFIELLEVLPLRPPQHQTAPSASTAQLKSEPCPAIAVTPAMPTTGVGGQLEPTQSAELPTPSWPLLVSPQHETEPLLMSAHACQLPHAMAIAPFTPKIVCGVECSRAVSPKASPQHTTAPFSRTAHAKAERAAPLPSEFHVPPALTATALLMAFTRAGTNERVLVPLPS